MKCSCFAIVGVASVFAAAGSLAFAQAQQPAKKETKQAAPKDHPQAEHPKSQPQTQGQPQLPPGWTEADMQACMIAGTPGEKQAYLAKAIGEWSGKCTMWMMPDAEPTYSTSTCTITDFMGGRYTKTEWAGDMPEGPFSGFGIHAYDNAGKQFQSVWVDNWSTGIMFGTGELSPDGKTMTWTFTHTGPITGKPTTFREIDRVTGENTRTMEMHGTDPKSGKEYKVMEVALTRSPGSQASALSISNRKAEAGCASCVYHMAGAKGCKLAVNMDGKTYLVRGADQVDAHQFCNGPKPVIVTGNVEQEWFVATAFQVQPAGR